MSTIANDAASARAHRSGIERSGTDLLRKRALVEPRRGTARAHLESLCVDGGGRQGLSGSPRPHTVTFAIAPDLRRRLGAIAEAGGASELPLYQAAVAGLLHALGVDSDLVSVESATGQAVSMSAGPGEGSGHTWLLRNGSAGDPSLADLLNRARAAAPAALRAPEWTVGSGPELGSAISRAVIDEANGLARFGDADEAWAPGPDSAALRFQFAPSPDGALEVRMVADAGRYDPATADMLARYLRNVLEQFADAPCRRVSELRLMTSAERDRVLGEWSTGVDPADLRGLATVFRHGRAVPGIRTVLRHGGVALTYGELFDRLGESGTAAADDAVVDRLIEQLAGLIPAAPVSPPTGRYGAEAAQQFVGPVATARLGRSTFPVDALVAAIADRRCVAADRRRADTDPARRRADVRLFALDPDDAQSVVDLLAALTDGATLVLATAAQRTDPAALAELIVEHAVTQVIAAPRLLADLAGCDTGPLPTVQRWDVAGIGWSAELSERLRQLAPDSVATCSYRVPGYLGAAARGSLRDRDRVRPVPGARILLLDKRLRPVAPGVLGDVHVGGIALASDSVAADRAGAFIDDPFEPGGRLFRTGDTARWTADGRLAFTRG
ncbi:AMP-binding protein [Nocardia cyriacigeorgica]|uniref:AMP-binding protein n=1 Tax=Nocardia cyriacigeorgica TaxID=135487 RepID=UPI001895BFEB|nr:AMP-binding protein [Nocardia cyriacigeorgica]MBF6161107.1 AMP-binding protein [Nocardia cyriacigeorgica]MBF6199906.1 AMP-binding protein [Nocardia cyriacigeorgica]MBF6319599.1 AMP-binding protein [Nocardia cyriacigeorgica]MBF6533617.1 AMP-binding protein [Nocardia cyriacigeorgica]